LDTAVWILVEERIGDEKRPPERNRQPTGSINIRTNTLVEKQVCTLEVVGELDHIGQTVTRLSKNGLRTTSKISKIFCYKCKVSLTSRHFIPPNGDF
jgi:hypothetical protein